jgi:hypothetical protein
MNQDENVESALQLEREKHRKTWRQLEQVKGLLREALTLPASNKTHDAIKANIRATLSQQTEQQPVARIGAVVSRKQRLFSIDILTPELLDVGTELFAAPIAQTAQGAVNE